MSFFVGDNYVGDNYVGDNLELSDVSSVSDQDVDLDDLIEEVRMFLKQREHGLFNTDELDREDMLILIDSGLGDVVVQSQELISEKVVREFHRNRIGIEKKKRKVVQKLKSRGEQREWSRTKSVEKKKRRIRVKNVRFE